MTTGIIISHRTNLGMSGARSWQTICVDRKVHISSDNRFVGGRTHDGGHCLHTRDVYRVESACPGGCVVAIVPSSENSRGKTIELPAGVDDLIKRFIESGGADRGELKQEEDKEWKDRVDDDDEEAEPQDD